MKSHRCVLSFYLERPSGAQSDNPYPFSKVVSPKNHLAAQGRSKSVSNVVPAQSPLLHLTSPHPRTNRRGQFIPSSSRLRCCSYLHKTIWHHGNQRTDVPRARGPDDRQNVAETQKDRQ